MQELASYKTTIDASVDRAFLESHGIEARIENEHIANANPLLGLAVGVKLRVKDEDLERAQQLLNENRT